MTGTANNYLWLDRYANKIGFGWLSNHFPYTIPPSYLYAITLIILVEPALTTWAYFAGYPLFYLENPYAILQPVAFVGAVYASRRLMKSYDKAMKEMEITKRTANPDSLTNIIPSWLPWAIFVLAVIYFYSDLVFDGMPKFSNPIEAIAALIINPLVWAPIGIQFICVYFSIEFLAPLRLRRSDIRLHFMDPEGIGGLRPIGELIKQAYYYMVAALVVYALILYHPHVDTKIVEVTEFATLTFTFIWVASIATVAFAVITLHRFMYVEKRSELIQLREQIHNHVEEPYDIVLYSVPDEKENEIEELRRRMEIVSSTKEYPATFSIWSHLLLAVIIPKGIQLFLDYLSA